MHNRAACKSLSRPSQQDYREAVDKALGHGQLSVPGMARLNQIPASIADRSAVSICGQEPFTVAPREDVARDAVFAPQWPWQKAAKLSQLQFVISSLRDRQGYLHPLLWANQVPIGSCQHKLKLRYLKNPCVNVELNAS